MNAVPPPPPNVPPPSQPQKEANPVTGGDYVVMQDFEAWQAQQHEELKAAPLAPQAEMLEAINLLLLQMSQQGKALNDVMREMQDQRNEFRGRLEEADAARLALEAKMTDTIRDLQARSEGVTFEERAAATARIGHDLEEAQGTVALSVDAQRRSTWERLKNEVKVPILVLKKTVIGINGIVFTLNPGTVEVPASVAQQYHQSLQVGEYATATQNVMSAEGEVPEYNAAQQDLRKINQQYGVTGGA